MPPKVQQKTKEQKMKAAMSGGKGRKKKWSKGKVKEKLNHSVLFDKVGMFLLGNWENVIVVHLRDEWLFLGRLRAETGGIGI